MTPQFAVRPETPRYEHPLWPKIQLPYELGDLAQDGAMSQVCAWLEAGGSVNAQDSGGYTLLACCALGSQRGAMIGDEQLALARHLISRGADVNIKIENGKSALHEACSFLAPGHSAMVSLLLASGANANARNDFGETPVAFAVGLENSNPEQAAGDWLEVVTLLLKRGASLDCCRNDSSAEAVFNEARETWNKVPHWANAENTLVIRDLLDGVRKHGSYKRYMRAPHRDVLACRGLAQRGKLATEHRALNFIARQGDNGIVWTVLSFWRATT